MNKTTYVLVFITMYIKWKRFVDLFSSGIFNFGTIGILSVIVILDPISLCGGAVHAS